MSEEYVNSVFDVFPDSVDDRSIHQYEYVRYAESSGLDLGKSFPGPTYKVVTKDLDAYLLMSKSYLDLVFRVSDDSDNLTDTELSSNVLAIFSKMSYMINSVPVDEVEHPVLCTDVKNLLQYSQDYLDKQGPMQFFYTDVTNAGAYNANSPRVLRLTGGAAALKVRCLIPLNRVFGFLDAFPSAMRGLEHRIELIKEDKMGRVAFADRAVGNGDGNAKQITIDQLSIWVPKLVPSPLAEQKYLQSIKNNDSSIVSYESWNGYRTLQQNGASLNWQINAASKKPKYVFVAFQKVARLDEIYGGGLDRNPNIFDHLNTTQIELRINSKRFPLERYRLDFSAATNASAGDYTRAYRDFLKIMDKDSEYDNGSLVDYDSYKNLYPIFAFDLSNDHSIFENVQTNYIEIEAYFSQAVGGQYYSNAVVVWDKEIKLTSNGSNLNLVRN